MNEWVSYRHTGNYNNFLLLASPDGDNRTMADVMAVWQLNFFGEVYVVYGQMSMEDLQLLKMGNVQMTHYCVSIQPMPKAYYEQLQKPAQLQEAGEKEYGVQRDGIGR